MRLMLGCVKYNFVLMHNSEKNNKGNETLDHIVVLEHVGRVCHALVSGWVCLSKKHHSFLGLRIRMFYDLHDNKSEVIE